MCYIIVILLF